MMGAQARAVEYNAARNALARQASREAEEQWLPPKQTPLSSFGRSAAATQSRNKGPKKFTPLVLESMGEEEIAMAENQANCSPAKVMSPPASGHLAGNEHDSNSSDRIRVNLPAVGTGAGGHTIPSAPRAMRPTADPFGSNTPTRMMMPLASSGPRVIQPASQYGRTPNANAPDSIFHPSLNTVGHCQGGTPEAMPMHGGGLPPLDLSPTKQECKLSAMSQIYGHHSLANRMETAFAPPPLPPPPPPPPPAFAAVPAQAQAQAAACGQGPVTSHATQVAYPYVEFPGVAIPAAWDIGQPPMMYNAAYPLPAMQYGRSEATPMSQTGPIFAPGRLIPRHHSWAEDYEARVTPSRVNMQLPPGEDSIGSKSRDSHGEAYDRSSKMQLFVAAQQAFAKTGKTVLNSREVDENQVSKQSPLPEHGPENTGRHEQAGLGTLPQAPPGFGSVPDGHERSGLETQESNKVKDVKDSEHGKSGKEEDDQAPLSEMDAMLHELFGVGTPEWFQLRSPTELDRQKMRVALHYVGWRMHDGYRRGDPRAPW